jgi:hypothetical protein
VVCIRVILVDLTEDCHAVSGCEGLPSSEWLEPHLTFPAKANSVPGRMHTAVVVSSGDANPTVPVPKFLVVSVSPILAERDLMLCRL